VPSFSVGAAGGG